MVSAELQSTNYLQAAIETASRGSGNDLPNPRRRVESVGVVGAGTMGSGIAMVFANAGLPVTLVEKDADGLARGLGRIREVYQRLGAKKTLPEAEVAARQARIDGQTDLAKLADADLVIEAVFEDMALKSDVFTRLDGIAKPDAILASNTSALDIDAIAAVTTRPQDVVGLHFFSPAHVMRLLEIVRGAKTDPSVVATAMSLAQQVGKVGVTVGVCDGFCANRMLYPYLRQADCLIEEGALPQDIDRALTSFGFAMGPCAMLDMAGQDVAWFVRQRQLKTWPRNMRYSRLADLLYERGRLGSKVGAGWYRYPSGPRSAEPDPEVEAMIVEESHRLGITRRRVADGEILDRCLYALVNEGARLLGEGIVRRSSDIDLCYVYGMGFPARIGGPMRWADSVGLANVYDAVVSLYRKHDENWAPAPLLDELAGSGRSFADFDQAATVAPGSR